MVFTPALHPPADLTIAGNPHVVVDVARAPGDLEVDITETGSFLQVDALDRVEPGLQELAVDHVVGCEELVAGAPNASAAARELAGLLVLLSNNAHQVGSVLL